MNVLQRDDLHDSIADILSNVFSRKPIYEGHSITLTTVTGP